MAAMPKPPEARKPVMIRTTVITAGTKMGLKMTRKGVAIVSAITVPARVKPERTRREPPAVTAVAAFTICLDCGCSVSRLIMS